MSVFVGQMREYSLMSLDRFDGRNLSSTFYWLSHAHSDHMRGLGSTALASHLVSDPRIKIYCSQVTKEILLRMDKYAHLNKHLVPLPIEQPVAVDVYKQHTSESFQVTVTLIPAGHCPGSAMLLIEGHEGTVLYTGDFRLEKGDVAQLTHLHVSGKPKVIDALYCDTTFLTRKAFNIARRSESEKELVRIVKTHIEVSDDHVVLLKMKAKLGYENVFRCLFEELGVKTHVQERDVKLYGGIPSILKTVSIDCKSKVHACCRYIQTEVCSSEDQNPPVPHCTTLRSSQNVLVVQLSTMWFVYNDEPQLSVQLPSYTRVCYSFHSSFSELEEFVRYLRPVTIYPNVTPVGHTLQQTQDLLNSFIISSSHSQLSDSWRSLDKVEVWWNATPINKSNSEDCDPSHSPCKQNRVNIQSSPDKCNLCSPCKRRHLSTQSSQDKCSTLRTESSPEFHLWSSSQESGCSQQTELRIESPTPDSDGSQEKIINANFNNEYQDFHHGNVLEKDITGQSRIEITVIDLTEEQSDSDSTVYNGEENDE